MMAGDDLNDPLGLDLGDRPSSRREIPYGKIAFAGVGLLAATLAAFAIMIDERRSGEPIAISRIDVQKQLASDPAPAG